MANRPPVLEPPGPNGFGDLFRESKGQPIQYQGYELVLEDRFSVTRISQLALSIESTNSASRQGVRLDPDANIRIDGRLFRSIALWEDTCPERAVIELGEDVKSLAVRNIWEDRLGTVHSWFAGAAMILNMVPGGRRYFCNDGELDADFDDIVFTLERLC